MRYLIHIDAPVGLLHECSNQPPIFDHPTDWIKTAERTVGGERRNYYVACPPWRILVVMRHGVDIRQMNVGAPASYADALVGWDDGASDFVRQENAGRRHTKITISTLYTWTPDDARAAAGKAGVEIVEWSKLLVGAPRSDQVGGYRGTQGRHRVGGDEPTVSVSIRLPESLVALARNHGNGDVSTGVRNALRGLNATPDAVTIASSKVIEHRIEPPTSPAPAAPTPDAWSPSFSPSPPPASPCSSATSTATAPRPPNPIEDRHIFKPVSRENGISKTPRSNHDPDRTFPRRRHPDDDAASPAHPRHARHVRRHARRNLRTLHAYP